MEKDARAIEKPNHSSYLPIRSLAKTMQKQEVELMIQTTGIYKDLTTD
jgi:hypothetical protein